MKGILAAIRDWRLIKHDAAVTLSGLRVRYDDGREPEVFEWWRLFVKSKSAVQILFSVLDEDGTLVKRDGRTLLLRVRGDEQMCIVRRAYLRGIKQTLAKTDVVITEPNRRSWGVLLCTSIILLFILIRCTFVILSSGKIPRIIDQHFTDPIYTNEFMIILLVICILFGIYISVFLWILILPLILDSLGLPFTLRAAQYSKKGLTCIRTDGTQDFHSWDELLPRPKALSHMTFADGFTTRLPTQGRGSALCRAIYEIHHRKDKKPVNLTVRILIYFPLTVALCGFVGYVTQNYGNEPFDPNRGFKKTVFVLLYIISFILLFKFNCRIGKWIKRRAKNKRHQMNALRAKGA